MKKETKLAIYGCAALFLLLLIAYPFTSGWWQPEAPAYAKEENSPAISISGSERSVSVTATPEPLGSTAPASPSPSHQSSSPPEAADTAASPAVAGAEADPSPSPAALKQSGGPAALASDGTVQAAVYGSKISIPVLNYHSVSIDPGNIVVIAPDKFEEHMKYLSDNGYTPLRLEQFFSILERKEAPPAKPILLTFDDGYTDNLEAAMPVLKKYGFPATLFMSPGMTETPGYLTWDQIKQLQEGGWDIQPHGMTHPHLPQLSAEKQAEQITEARRLIEEHLQIQADVFCYPYGEYTKATLNILEKNGFRYAFTIDQGKTTPSQHPYKLKRIFVNGEEKLSSLVHKLTKW